MDSRDFGREETVGEVSGAVAALMFALVDLANCMPDDVRAAFERKLAERVREADVMVDGVTASNSVDLADSLAQNLRRILAGMGGRQL